MAHCDRSSGDHGAAYAAYAVVKDQTQATLRSVIRGVLLSWAESSATQSGRFEYCRKSLQAAAAVGISQLELCAFGRVSVHGRLDFIPSC